MVQENYLALDIGEKRIGVAVGSVVPFGRGYLDATQPDEVRRAVGQLIQDQGITTIIVGVPRVKSGEVTESQRLALDWASNLAQAFGLPVKTVDESYSSQEAEHQLRQEKVDFKIDKWRVDERAAELILAQYLSQLANPHA